MASKKTSRPQAELEALIRGYTEDWANFFGVSHQWTIHTSFVHSKDMDDSASAAEILWPTPYTTAALKYNIDTWKSDSDCDCDFEEMAAHEMGHLVEYAPWDYICANFSGPLRRIMLDFIERQIDIWTRIAIRARYGDDYRCTRCSGVEDAAQRPEEETGVCTSVLSTDDTELSSVIAQPKGYD